MHTHPVATYLVRDPGQPAGLPLRCAFLGLALTAGHPAADGTSGTFLKVNRRNCNCITTIGSIPHHQTLPDSPTPKMTHCRISPLRTHEARKGRGGACITSAGWRTQTPKPGLNLTCSQPRVPDLLSPQALLRLKRCCETHLIRAKRIGLRHTDGPHLAIQHTPEDGLSLHFSFAHHN